MIFPPAASRGQRRRRPHTLPTFRSTGNLHPMPIEKWSDKVVVIHLADEPQFSEDMSALESAGQNGKVDAVVDFAAVHFINSSNIAQLLRIRKAMHARESR